VRWRRVALDFRVWDRVLVRECTRSVNGLGDWLL